MEKLTINHLAPYLPYELEGLISNFGGIVTLSTQTSNYHRTWSIDMFLGETSPVKPIVKPLSQFGDSDDLRKVHEFIGLGKWCDAYDDYFKIWFDDAQNIDKLVLQAPYEIFQYFLANHYDVFSLIPKGLAVDINTLNP